MLPAVGMGAPGTGRGIAPGVVGIARAKESSKQELQKKGEIA
jgi:hypothetical protein